MSRSAQRWPVRPLTGLVAVPALAVVGLLLVFASRDGFHRDELYFIQSMHHPAWGYIDNPSLTPAVGWLSQRLFGDSEFGLRVLPAVEVGLVVLVVVALTRELGGELAAQLVAGATCARIDVLAERDEVSVGIAERHLSRPHSRSSTPHSNRTLTRTCSCTSATLARWT